VRVAGVVVRIVQIQINPVAQVVLVVVALVAMEYLGS